MGWGHIGEWIKRIKKFLYHFEILAVVFELEKETSKPILNCATRIRRTAHTRAATCRERKGMLRRLVQRGMAVLCVLPHRAYTTVLSIGTLRIDTFDFRVTVT